MGTERLSSAARARSLVMVALCGRLSSRTLDLVMLDRRESHRVNDFSLWRTVGAVVISVDFVECVLRRTLPQDPRAALREPFCTNISETS